MIHYSCDCCKRIIDLQEELRYVVRMEVYAAMDPQTTIVTTCRRFRTSSSVVRTPKAIALVTTSISNCVSIFAPSAARNFSRIPWCVKRLSSLTSAKTERALR